MSITLLNDSTDKNILSSKVMRKPLALVILYLSLISNVSSQPVAIKSGFLTGNEYLARDEAERRDYAVGFVDGVLLAPVFGATKTKMKWIEDCLTEMTNAQVAAILEYYLKNNPGRWHEQMNILAFVALKESCGE